MGVAGILGEDFRLGGFRGKVHVIVADRIVFIGAVKPGFHR